MDAVDTVLCPNCGIVPVERENVVVLCHTDDGHVRFELAFRCPACQVRRAQAVSHSAAKAALDRGCDMVRVLPSSGPPALSESEIEDFLAALEQVEGPSDIPELSDGLGQKG